MWWGTIGGRKFDQRTCFWERKRGVFLGSYAEVNK